MVLWGFVCACPKVKFRFDLQMYLSVVLLRFVNNQIISFCPLCVCFTFIFIVIRKSGVIICSHTVPQELMSAYFILIFYYYIIISSSLQGDLWLTCFNVFGGVKPGTLKLGMITNWHWVCGLITREHYKAIWGDCCIPRVIILRVINYYTRNLKGRRV